MRSSTGNNSSAGSQACAACKYQRRKCAPNCLLAPYFPATHQKDFLNAHKLFGVSNITKTIKPLDPQQRAIAMKSIIYQANVRANDPVGGCFRIISELQTRIDWTKAELDFVLNQLSIYKGNRGSDEVNAMQEDLEGLNVFDAFSIPYQPPCREGGEGNMVQDNYNDGSSSQVYNVFDSNSVKVEAEGTGSGSCKPGLSDVDDDIKPLLASFDDKGAGAGTFPFDFKAMVQCSDNKVVSKEDQVRSSIQHDLKDAASLFTLTNGKG